MLIVSCTTGMFAFVILKNGVTDDDKVIFEALQKLVRKMIAAFAVPNTFLVSLQFQHNYVNNHNSI